MCATGIYVANRARIDSKAVKAVVDYASKQAAAGTGKLLLAASGAASPALLLMGVNTTETQAALNNSVQLLSMGIVPDSISLSPKLLTSLKDFDDDDKRLDAAYQRQRRRRSKPLPARLLGSLPSTINKASDLAYEVEQEVKYERAGSRANKLLKPIGLSLPEAKRNGLLLGRTPSGSAGKRLEASDASLAANSSPSRILGSRRLETTPAVVEPLVQEVSARREAMTPAPDPVGVFDRFERKGVDAQGGGISSTERALAEMLASQPDVFTKQLSKCVDSIGNEVQLQERGVRAANAVLCATEPVIAGLEEALEREAVLLEELKNVTRNVQQMYVLAEMSEAVEAAETYLRRLEVLSANVVELAVCLEAYIGGETVRIARLETIKSRVLETRGLGGIQDSSRAAQVELSSRTIGLLQSFDGEVVAGHEEAKAVGGRLDVVWRESAERARDEAGHAHEYALVAACRLWKAAAVEGTGKRASTSDSVRLELTRIQEIQDSTTSTMGVPSKVGRKEFARATGAEVRAGEGDRERLRAVEDEAARDMEGGDQQASVAPVERGVTAAPTPSFPGRSQADHDIKLTPPMTASPDITPVAGESTTVQTTEADMVVDLDQSVKSAEVVDAVVVDEAPVRGGSAATSRDENSSRRSRDGGLSRKGSLSAERTTMASEESSIELVVDESSSFVDVEAEMEDDVSDPARVGLKFLDVFALLIEKVLFVGLPTLVSGGSLVWQRVDNAVNGAKGRKGWKLLDRLKKDSAR
ncbi:expressed unknown protein [Ectocarpus siliculosus]|uniref:Uncharacterized protein n=1 Tax=Ectocarpus siliculosus TaxID=2880 RepID=D7FW68_ECTSI|nr:expressed unknown protein [Ectocarpus siliculosus]|eukprot:CBJ25588.1 expressed unknown protein [Ectocarpus siliculosus]